MKKAQQKKAQQKKASDKCLHCIGSGRGSDCRGNEFGCPWCAGTGKLSK